MSYRLFCILAPAVTIVALRMPAATNVAFLQPLRLHINGQRARLSGESIALAARASHRDFEPPVAARRNSIDGPFREETER
jgi:hypothetical protein